MKKLQLAGIIALSVLMASVTQAQQAAGPSVNEPSRTLNKGTQIKVKSSEQIASQTNNLGDTISAVIANDVKDATGQVIFPEGSRTQLQVIETNGGLGLVIKGIKASGQRYGLRSSTRDFTGAGRGGDRIGANIGTPGQRTRAWNVFKKNKDGIGVASDVKEPAVGGDFVIPAGTEITFDYGNEAFNIVSY